MAKYKKLKTGDYDDYNIYSQEESEIEESETKENQEEKREKKKKSKKISKTRKKILIITLIVLIILVLFLDLILIRQFSERQLDDVNPQIQCDSSLINKSQTLMIIPIYQGTSIAENKAWCDSILKLNKTLGMHGIYHNFNEFQGNLTKDYVLEGMKEFEKCFGYTPKIFEAPQLSLTKENKLILKNLSLEIRNYGFNFFHKVYHCNDTGKFTNKIIDIF